MRPGLRLGAMKESMVSAFAECSSIDHIIIINPCEDLETGSALLRELECVLSGRLLCLEKTREFITSGFSRVI